MPLQALGSRGGQDASPVVVKGSYHRSGVNVGQPMGPTHYSSSLQASGPGSATLDGGDAE